MTDGKKKIRQVLQHWGLVNKKTDKEIKRENKGNNYL